MHRRITHILTLLAASALLLLAGNSENHAKTASGVKTAKQAVAVKTRVAEGQAATANDQTSSGKIVTDHDPSVQIITPPDQSESGPAATYEVEWYSINAGGAPMSSTSYDANASAGQSVTGAATSANYDVGSGYWYGAFASEGGACQCPFQCDYDADGFLTALDLGKLIDVLFAGNPEITDPDCTTSRGDFDCDGFPTALDLGNLIDHLFAGGPGPCDPCTSVRRYTNATSLEHSNGSYADGYRPDVDSSAIRRSTRGCVREKSEVQSGGCTSGTESGW